MIDIKISRNSEPIKQCEFVFVGRDAKLSLAPELAETQKVYIQKALESGDEITELNLLDYWIYATGTPSGNSNLAEEYRKLGYRIFTLLKKGKSKACNLVCSDPENILYIAEGILLSAYSFNKYFTDKNKRKNTLQSLNLISEELKEEDLNDLLAIVEGTYFARNLVNEPQSFLNAEQFAEEIQNRFSNSEIKFEAFNEAKIESLKMGGVLAVNKGSVDPPVFITIEYKPENAINTSPIIFVGKGIVYDTGGLSLKPTENSMDMMKCDMAGGAVVAGAIDAISRAKLPYHIVGLIPATDNRPGGNAFAPGDVITMMDGTTVEVMNTDAEGRLVLADALSYADRYKPELAIDLATLTGASVAAIGQHGGVMMGTAENSVKEKLKTAGENAFERLVELPMWEEYGEEITSPIADLKNLGGRTAGAITAGKFLEHFTNYPWIHVDIAGPSFLSSNSFYRPKGGSGFGVRLLFNFIKNYSAK